MHTARTALLAGYGSGTFGRSHAIVADVTDDAVDVRVVEWNVAMALHRKAGLLADLAPSIAILPETAHPDKTRPALEAVGAT